RVPVVIEDDAVRERDEEQALSGPPSQPASRWTCGGAIELELDVARGTARRHGRVVTHSARRVEHHPPQERRVAVRIAGRVVGAGVADARRGVWTGRGEGLIDRLARSAGGLCRRADGAN